VDENHVRHRHACYTFVQLAERARARRDIHVTFDAGV